MKLSAHTSTILIATFSPWIGGKRLPINGNLEPLLDFFVPKSKKTVLIDQPYPGSDFVMPRIEVYTHGRKTIHRSSWWLFILYPFLRLVNSKNPGVTHVSFKIRDFLSILDWTFCDKTMFDLYIGLESINALAGIILKKLGKIKTVVYYVSDYSPKRYQKGWFNKIYLWLDRIAATHADYIWDVSPAMQPARIKVGLDPNKSAPVLHVPNALYPEQIKAAPLSDIEPFSLVFMGTLGTINGPDLAIKAMPIILEKYPQTILHIIGGNPFDMNRLKLLVSKLQLKQSVIFHGFIDDREKISLMIRKFAIALAPYPNIVGSARLYGDATKIRAYLAAGMATITTDVPPLGRVAAQSGAVIIVEDIPEGIAEGVMKIFRDKPLFYSLRRKALQFAKNNTWENEFSHALKMM